MKKILFSLSLALPLASQVYTPPSGGSSSRPSGGGNDTVVRSNPQPGPSNNKTFGNELPFYNPAGETISWNGSTWAASDNRFFEARFQKYLNEPEESSEEAEKYRATIEEILAMMSPHRKGGPVFRDAVALLPRASSYPGDARLCDSLSNAIYTAMLARKDVRGTKALITAMEKEKKRVIGEADWKAKTDRDISVGDSQPVGGGSGGGNGKNKGGTNGQATQTGRGVNSLDYLNKQKRILEIEALKKGHQLKTEIKTELAKMQYQALMVQFFLQRRFEHVVMASRFYNQIWSDGDGTLYLDDKSDLDKMFTESLGVSPTVSTLDSLANEAMHDVNKGVEAFLFLVEQDELESASKRLSESYMVGEFMPSINILARAKKRKVLEFVRGSYVLLNAIESKDFDKAAEQIKTLNGQAKDFDATKAQSAIAGYTRASNMSISMAKQHFAKGDVEKAREEVQKAVEIWPQNPKLAEIDRLVDAGGSMIQLRNDFDRLFAEKNYREVFKRQHELAPSINNDSDRQEKFRQVIENIGTIELAIKGSEELGRLGQHYAAWEKLKPIYDRFPDDPNLNQVMTQMQGRASAFTNALDRADSLEENGNIGSSLSWFYRAKDLHPGSTRAADGIKRLVDRALNLN
jgi:tetratricopeptide (TPR) repeat protein